MIWADTVGSSKDRKHQGLTLHEAPSPSGPATLLYLSHHDSRLWRASHTPGTELTSPP